ncbi:MAG: DUF2933 domain-containing protein [Methylophaga sp.]|nr:DUF2933 domain-containing protein [Methylophaga sp.]
MSWLLENWLLILFVICCIAMMIFMHGAHGHSDDK